MNRTSAGLHRSPKPSPLCLLTRKVRLGSLFVTIVGTVGHPATRTMMGVSTHVELGRGLPLHRSAPFPHHAATAQVCCWLTIGAVSDNSPAMGWPAANLAANGLRTQNYCRCGCRVIRTFGRNARHTSTPLPGPAGSRDTDAADRLPATLTLSLPHYPDLRRVCEGNSPKRTR